MIKLKTCGRSSVSKDKRFENTKQSYYTADVLLEFVHITNKLVDNIFNYSKYLQLKLIFLSVYSFYKSRYKNANTTIHYTNINKKIANFPSISISFIYLILNNCLLCLSPIKIKLNWMQNKCNNEI